jgi:hypothetical protein
VVCVRQAVLLLILFHTINSVSWRSVCLCILHVCMISHWCQHTHALHVTSLLHSSLQPDAVGRCQDDPMRHTMVMLQYQSPQQTTLAPGMALVNSMCVIRVRSWCHHSFTRSHTSLTQ